MWKYILIILTTLVAVSAHAENDLGTRKEVSEKFNREYDQAVVEAFPSFKSAVIQRRLQSIQKKYLRGFDPLKIKNFTTLQKTFRFPIQDIRPGQTFVEKEKVFAYELDRSSGRLYIHKNMEKVPPMKKILAQRQLKQVKKQHDQLMTRLGIDRSQLLFTETNFMLLQTGPAPGGNQRPSAVMVDSFFTYAVRAIDGLMVDGSFVRLNSKNAKTLYGVDITWPKFSFHPALKNFELKKNQLLIGEISRIVNQTMVKGDKINVKMAMVLRPVWTGRTLHYIPSMKVGVHSGKGEAGNMFYVDVLKQRVKYDVRANKDSSEGH
ncbi:MAG: hypothetical protein HOE90_02365 [Bacteriovoracaceae bacterium]|jgi:hypothetical protein|nr:hypothetical protein [Bacteriovoracaceae bacterium]